MRKYFWLLPLLLVLSSLKGFTQNVKIDSSTFFTDNRTIDMTLSTDFKKLYADKMKMIEQPATLTIQFPDSSKFTGDITIRARGITRKESCYMPPLMLNFKTANSGGLEPLHKLKLVCGCANSSDDEKLLLKEYLAYRIYNLMTDLSFRVRLVHITYQDTRGKQKTYTQNAFLIEDDGAMAKRNKCKDIKKPTISQERTNRQQMTLVSLFEYMIGNTDWSTLNGHNTKLLQPKSSTTEPPYVVPYDFDYCGLVNAYYAVPSEILDIKDVTQRAYRGFPRTMEELEESISIFNKQKENVTDLIMNCEPLPPKTRKETMGYLEDFYKTINNKRDVKDVFITNARTE